MIVYLDTSVLLRRVLGEAGGLRQWRSIEIALSSELIVVEALRTIDRARLRLGLDDTEVAARRSDLLGALSALHLVRLGRKVLDRAAEPFPTLLGTLDAIHLATASLLREERPALVFATHYVELGQAARAIGFRVVGA